MKSSKLRWLAAGLAAAAVVVAGFLVRPAPAGAAVEKTYVLMADAWGPAQDAAVAMAGGTVTFKHAPTGIGVATSWSPGFLRKIASSGAFGRYGEDQVVAWQPPLRHYDVEASAITPGDEFYSPYQWNLTAVDAPGAWNAGFSGMGARVAVLDGGIFNLHYDLAARIDTAASHSFVPGTGPFEDTGTFWHGTHVAGIIAASDNGFGVIGIAPEATIIGVKVLHGGSGAFSWVIEGILYASTPLAEGGAGADIINMSLGATFLRGGGNTGAGPLVAALNRAVNYAGANTLVVCSAGNNGLDLDHSGSVITVPAMSGSGIAVSATGPNGFAYGATDFRRMASYTNFGNSLVWLAAPGGDSPLYPDGLWWYDMVLSTVRGSTDPPTYWYSWASGTSMAAPAVSAVAALVKQRYPNISVGDLKTLLARTADDEGKVGNDPFYGKGFVNAKRAVTE